MFTFDEINDTTGFANGAEFESAEQVRAYFTAENMAEMMGGFDPTDRPDALGLTQQTLNNMADTVIENGWHMEA